MRTSSNIATWVFSTQYSTGFTGRPSKGRAYGWFDRSKPRPGTEEPDSQQGQSPAQAAFSHVRLVAGAPKVRPDVHAVAIIRDFPPRCSPEAIVAASADLRRYQPRVFAGQLPLAGWATQASTAATSPASLDVDQRPPLDGLDGSRAGSPRWCVRSATAIPTPAACCSVIWSMSSMKRCLAAFASAVSLFAPVAHANDALEAKVRAYAPVVSLAKVCDIRINDATSGDHRAMLEAVKSDPNANKLAYRLHYETQTAYIKARDGGQRVAFCKDFIAANSQYAKARVTAVVEGHMSDVSTSVQKAIAHNVCGAPPAKLSKADWKPYALIKQMLQIEHKLAKENAETNGWNVTEETTAVTEQFCAAVKTR